MVEIQIEAPVYFNGGDHLNSNGHLLGSYLAVDSGYHRLKMFLPRSATSESAYIDRIMTAIAWALALSTLAAVVEVAWFHIEPLGLFSNRDFFAEAAAPVFVWARLKYGAQDMYASELRRLVGRDHSDYKPYRRCCRGVDRNFLRNLFCQSAVAAPLIFCGSRLSVLAAMSGIAIARPRWWWQTLIALPILAELGTKAMEYHGKLASLKERGQIWHQTAFHLTPWGHGMGSFALAYPHWEWAHSDALQAISELGIGVLPFALVIAWLLWHAGTLRGPFVAALITACGGFSLHEAGSGLIASVLAGGIIQRLEYGKVR